MLFLSQRDSLPQDCSKCQGHQKAVGLFLKKDHDVLGGDAELAPAEVGMAGHPAPEPHGLAAGPVSAER